VASHGAGWERELVAGDVIAFRPGQQHNLVGLEPGSRVVNIRYGGDHG
jgi:quercetin dioxygenase-like cupin family protein